MSVFTCFFKQFLYFKFIKTPTSLVETAALEHDTFSITNIYQHRVMNS